jgi:hypothetical protein
MILANKGVIMTKIFAVILLLAVSFSAYKPTYFPNGLDTSRLEVGELVLDGSSIISSNANITTNTLFSQSITTTTMSVTSISSPGVTIVGTLTANKIYATSIGAGLSGSTFTHIVNGSPLTANIEVHSEGTSDLGGIAIHRHTDTAAAGSTILNIRSNGPHSAPTTITNNDVISRYLSAGYDGTDYAYISEIRTEADGAMSASSMPGRIVFGTTPSGSTTTTEKLRITQAGNIGIGTTAPNALLHVKDGTTAGMRRTVKLEHGSPATDGNGAYIEFSASTTDGFGAQIGGVREGGGGTGALVIRTGTNGQTERMRINNAGNVGIGVITPSVKLEVAGVVSVSSLTTMGTITANKFVGDGSDLTGVVAGISTSNADLRYLGILATANFAITANWANNPTSIGPTGNTGATGATGNFIADLSYVTNNYYTNVNIQGTLTANKLVASTTLNAVGGYYSGNVGIGTTAPSAKLEVAGTVSASALQVNGLLSQLYSGAFPAAFITGTSGVPNVNGGTGSFRTGTTSLATIEMGAYGTTPFHSWIQAQAAGGAKAIAINPLGGNVGINIPTPSTALEVAGTVSASALIATALPAANETALYVSATGVISKATSSRRYKTNISTLDADSSRIYDIDVKGWNYLSDQENISTKNVSGEIVTTKTIKKVIGQRNIGPIAEDVAIILPKLVNYSNGQPESLKDSQFIWLIIEEMKKLKTRLDAAGL